MLRMYAIFMVFFVYSTVKGTQLPSDQSQGLPQDMLVQLEAVLQIEDQAEKADKLARIMQKLPEQDQKHALQIIFDRENAQAKEREANLIKHNRYKLAAGMLVTTALVWYLLRFYKEKKETDAEVLRRVVRAVDKASVTDYLEQNAISLTGDDAQKWFSDTKTFCWKGINIENAKNFLDAAQRHLGIRYNAKLLMHDTFFFKFRYLCNNARCLYDDKSACSGK